MQGSRGPSGISCSVYSEDQAGMPGRITRVVLPAARGTRVPCLSPFAGSPRAPRPFHPPLPSPHKQTPQKHLHPCPPTPTADGAGHPHGLHLCTDAQPPHPHPDPWCLERRRAVHTVCHRRGGWRCARTAAERALRTSGLRLEPDMVGVRGWGLGSRTKAAPIGAAAKYFSAPVLPGTPACQSLRHMSGTATAAQGPRHVGK